MPSAVRVATLALLIAAAAAAEPAAHDPHYADRSLWTEDVVKSEHHQQAWPKARLLVWAETKGNQKVDLRDAGRWLEDGKPAASGPDKTTDILFPDGSYSVKGAGKETFTARHVTIGAGVSVGIPTADFDGNLWIRAGGKLSCTHQRYGGTDKSTFCRSDNAESLGITNMYVMNKQKGKAMEWIGRWHIGDEVTMVSGRFIVGPGSTFLGTDRRSQNVHANAELVLLSGATFSLRGNYYRDIDLQIDGALLAGTPERPLTKDCTLGLSFKGEAAEGRDALGLYVSKDARLAVTSADPDQARLVFRWHRRPNESFPEQNKESAATAAMPHGITMLLLGSLTMRGVVFEDVIPGGILLADPAQRKQWQSVSFGKGNFAEGDALFAAWTKTPPPANKGGDGRSKIK